MTRKSDMSSRYAAAHARREQRRKQSQTREYLPLAEEYYEETPVSAGGRVAAATGQGATTTMSRATSRLAPIDYTYLRGDLMRIATMAVVLFAGMIILSFILH